MLLTSLKLACGFGLVSASCAAIFLRFQKTSLLLIEHMYSAAQEEDLIPVAQHVLRQFVFIPVQNNFQNIARGTTGYRVLNFSYLCGQNEYSLYFILSKDVLGASLCVSISGDEWSFPGAADRDIGTRPQYTPHCSKTINHPSIL